MICIIVTGCANILIERISPLKCAYEEIINTFCANMLTDIANPLRLSTRGKSLIDVQQKIGHCLRTVPSEWLLKNDFKFWCEKSRRIN